MKRILVAVFMVVFAMSAFATVDLQTTTKNLNPNECSPIGAMKFVVANTQDFLQDTSVGGILIKVTLKGRTSLLPVYIKNQMPDQDPTLPQWRPVYTDLDGGEAVGNAHIDNGLNVPMVFWLAECDNPYDYFFVWVPANAVQNAPISVDDAWFTVSPDPDPSFHNLANPIRVDTSALMINENVEAAVEDFWLDSRPDNPYVDAWNVLAQQVTNYQPSDPSVGLVRGDEEPQVAAIEVCPLDKYDNPVKPDPVYLCKTWSVEQDVDPLCEDGYRHGTICTIEIELENLDLGMYVTLEADDPDVYIVFEDAIGTQMFNVVTALNAGTPEACLPFVWDGQTGQIIQNGVSEVNCGGGAGMIVGNDFFIINGFVYTKKVQIPVNSIGDGLMTVTGLELARLTTMQPVEDVDLLVGLTMQDCTDPCLPGELIAYAEFPNDGLNAEMFWRCCSCVADYGTVAVADVLDFLACADILADLGPDTEVIYYTYFPVPEGKWWSGLAFINTTPLKNFTGFPVTEQDISVTLYIIEADGDMFMMDAGYIVPGGIFITTFEDGMAGVTALQQGDQDFGDERFWVVGVATGTMPGTYITVDGFGMLGDDVQAQGYLARLNVESYWMGLGWTGVYNK